jgi:hypothetical protein
MQNKNIEDLFEKRMTTIMIGALARFEENFDYLWEDNKANADYFLSLWQKARQEVLDYGNNQIRLAQKDLEKLYNQKHTKYKYHYKFDMRRFNDEHEN